MSDYLCHDFKSPRNDAARRLPNSFRLIPVTFYFAIVAGAYFITMDVINYKRSQQSKADAEQVKKQHEEERDRHNAELADLETETAKGIIVAKWIEGTRVVQPICVKAAAAVSEDVGISDLSIDRNPELPAQMDLIVRMVGGSPKTVEDIQTAMGRLNYRSYSPQRNPMGEKGLEYRTTLVFQNH
ncbi:MAG: hypothetical protein KDK97_12600 [Verrucomicrobiales bacterium]|nr:hypothetical protein [Verrucomicrobiales bacterium]